MEPNMAVELVRRALLESFWLSGPLLLVAFLAGAVISLVQIVTSIQDSSFGTLPKLAIFLLGLMVLLPWMTTRMLVYTTGLLGDLSRYGR
jgi:flagellar biosynthetic protein FliQ